LTEVVEGLHGSDRQPVDADLDVQVKDRKRRTLEDELRQGLGPGGYAKGRPLRGQVRAQAQENYAKASQLRDRMRTEDAEP